MQHIPQYEGTSGDHASVFDSFSELAVKSITFIFIFLNGLKEGLKNSQKKIENENPSTLTLNALKPIFLFC